MDIIILTTIAYFLFIIYPLLMAAYMTRRLYDSLNFELQYKIASLPDKLTWPFRRTYGKLARFFYWGWNLRNSYDWDYSYLYEIMLLKMKRMYTAIENGSTEEKEKKKILRTLKDAINYCDKLLKDDYTRNLDKVDQKWGEHEFAFNPSETKGFSTMYSFNRNALNPKDQKKADKEILNAYQKDEFEKTMDKMGLFQTMEENIGKWWD